MSFRFENHEEKPIVLELVRVLRAHRLSRYERKVVLQETARFFDSFLPLDEREETFQRGSEEFLREYATITSTDQGTGNGRE